MADAVGADYRYFREAQVLHHGNLTIQPNLPLGNRGSFLESEFSEMTGGVCMALSVVRHLGGKMDCVCLAQVCVELGIKTGSRAFCEDFLFALGCLF